MATYLLIESRDPFDSRDSDQFYEIAQGLAEGGNDVTLFLIQNGVLPTRKESTHAARLSELARSRVKLMADSFSWKERGIRSEEMVSEARSSDVGELVDRLLTDGTKAIWH